MTDSMSRKLTIITPHCISLVQSEKDFQTPANKLTNTQNFKWHLEPSIDTIMYYIPIEFE